MSENHFGTCNEIVDRFLSKIMENFTNQDY
jgi:hypothetical protein